MRHFKDLYVAIKGEFLVPPHYLGHPHDWVQLDAGMCICQLCGAEHICFRGDCPTIQMEQSEQVCSISGCVIVLSEMKAEWGAFERVNAPPSAISLKGGAAARFLRTTLKPAAAAACPQEIPKTNLRPSTNDTAPAAAFQLLHPNPASAAVLCKRTSTIHDTVEMVVREILDSPKTARCLVEEATRDQARQHACLAKLVRELAANQHHCKQRPNLLHIEAKLSWQCHKCRRILVVPSMLSPSLAFLSAQQQQQQQQQQHNKKHKTAQCTAKTGGGGGGEKACTQYASREVCAKGLKSGISKSNHSSSNRGEEEEECECDNRSDNKNLKNMKNRNTKKKQNKEHNSNSGHQQQQQQQQQQQHDDVDKYAGEFARTEILRRVIRLCVDNICDLIQNYGWHRVDRQLQHASRGREFICSMLYLMRMGITFKNQTILQKMEILNSLLPLQVFLPTIFNIRAKSITEGENIIKLDLQHIPL